MIKKLLILLPVLFLFLNSQTKANDISSSRYILKDNIRNIDCEFRSLQDLKRFTKDNEINFLVLALSDSLYENDSVMFLDTAINAIDSSSLIDSSNAVDSNIILDSSFVTDSTITIDSSFALDSNKILNKKLKIGLDKPLIEKKNVALMLGEQLALELIPLAMAKFISKPGWEQISLRSWWQNISEGFTYDTDNFLTNHFSHPYHGNLYFNAARTNGYGFWESVPFPFLGSAVWEYFAETFRPSINDWVNTSVSGVNLGEMTYRISNMITDNEARGINRVWTEILGGIINPVRGINRLLTGEASRVFRNPPLKTPDYFSFSINVGARRIVTEGSNLAKGVQQGIFGFDVNYGDQFHSDLKIPFSTFFVSASLSNTHSRVTDLRSYGILTGWKLREDEKTKHSLSLLLSYDFTSNPAYEFGGPSLSANLGSRYEISEKFNIITNVNFGSLLMGGAPDDFFNDEEGRDYNFGTGLIARAYVSFNGVNWQYGSLSYSTFWFWTQSGTPDSKHHIHNFNATGIIPLSARFALGGSMGLYYRTSKYVIEGDIRKTSPIIRVFFITKL